jgi:hypothetical protein
MSVRETILAADDIAEETVPVPEWNVKILLRGMTGKQQARYVRTIQADDSMMFADILMVTAYDPETRQLVFDPADREALADKSGAVLNRLGMIVLGMSGTDVDEAVEEVEADPTSGGV